MASDFWSRQLGVPSNEPQRPSAPAQRAWWQDPDPYQQAAQPALQRQMPQASMPGQRTDEQYIRQLKSIPAQSLTAEQMEQLAEYELRTKPNQNSSCPQCGSGNFVQAGARVAGVIMPTNKCFNCGGGARSPEPAVGGGGGGRASAAARQIDTGGGAGSMYLKFRGVPASYMPKGG